MARKNKVRIGKVEDAENESGIEVKVELMPEGKIQCTMCGRLLPTGGHSSSFHRSNSILHKGNGGYIPICKRCVADLYKAYKKALGSDLEATRRMCQKLDAYFNENLFGNTWDKYHDREASFKFGEYLKTLNLYVYRGKTFDTTIDEEEAKMRVQMAAALGEGEVDEDLDISPEQVRVWGAGFGDSTFYKELDQRYSYWTEDLDIEKMDKATETLIRQICIQEVTLSHDAAAGKPIDRTAKLIDSLLGSLNLKPVQKQQVVSEDAVDEETEMTPFGVWIQQIENDRPIPEPEEQFADVDHLKEYIQTWFVGGLSNMMRIPNQFSDMFDRAMAEYTVEKPEYKEDDEDTSIDDLFEKAEEEGRKKILEVEDYGRKSRNAEELPQDHSEEAE